MIHFWNKNSLNNWKEMMLGKQFVSYLHYVKLYCESLTKYWHWNWHLNGYGVLMSYIVTQMVWFGSRKQKSTPILWFGLMKILSKVKIMRFVKSTFFVFKRWWKIPGNINSHFSIFVNPMFLLIKNRRLCLI